MRQLFLLASFLIAPLVSAQELHTFSNGEVADAEKINQNFQYVLENATGSGGCSAEQDGSSVVITCADGTSGVLASAGTVSENRCTVAWPLFVFSSVFTADSKSSGILCSFG